MRSRERAIEDIIDFIKQIASKEFQERGWVKGEVHDYCSYLDTITILFNDCFFEEYIDDPENELGFTENQLFLLRGLRDMLNDFDNYYGGWEDPKKIITDPRWLKIRSKAQEVLKAFGVESYLDPSKEIVKDSLLTLIHKLANPIRQKELWIDNKRPSSKPFEEFLDDFYRTSRANEVITQYKDYEITEPQVEALKTLYMNLDRYKDKIVDTNDLQKILDDPEWHEIQKLAKEVIKIFNYQTFNERYPD
jgi:hypothetical protein